MTTPKGKINKINRRSPMDQPKAYSDSRGDIVFDKELSKIRRPAYEERMNFKEVIVTKKVKTATGNKFVPVPITKEKVSRRRWKILQEIRLKNSL